MFRCSAVPVQAQSVTQTFPSRSTWSPWGVRNIPAPKLRIRVPVESKWRMGSRVEPEQVLVPHRSATQTLRPSGAISTPEVEPQVRPAGIRAHPSIVRQGLGSWLTGAIGEAAVGPCAGSAPGAPAIASSAAAVLTRDAEFTDGLPGTVRSGEVRWWREGIASERTRNSGPDPEHTPGG